MEYIYSEYRVIAKYQIDLELVDGDEEQVANDLSEILEEYSGAIEKQVLDFLKAKQSPLAGEVIIKPSYELQEYALEDSFVSMLFDFVFKTEAPVTSEQEGLIHEAFAEAVSILPPKGHLDTLVVTEDGDTAWMDVPVEFKYEKE